MSSSRGVFDRPCLYMRICSDALTLFLYSCTFVNDVAVNCLLLHFFGEKMAKFVHFDVCIFTTPLTPF